MTAYSFVTEWKLKAPLEAVWKLILASNEWPTWWKGVLELKAEMPTGLEIFQIIPGGAFYLTVSTCDPP
jgi:uncharacterized protein YndB with AHSA1/START domain